jgi:hypothetical protein
LNVFDVLSTKVRKGNRQDFAHLIVCFPGDTHASGARQCLQSRSDVHARAEEVPSAHDHVPDVHANAESNAPIGCNADVRFGQRGLRIYGALHGLYGACELRKNTIARRVGYAAPMVPNESVEDRAPFGQALERADFVSAHETAVALHICCENGDEASADFRVV